MQNELSDQWTKFSKTSFGALKELTEMNAKAIEKLTEQQLALVTTCVEGTVAQLKLLGEAKGYKDLFSGQSELAGEYSNKALAIARKAADILNECKDEFTALVEKGVESATVNPYTKPSTPKKAA
ncbi:MAG: phasin family protein [Gammaproteobacteria bacterium]|nr:phasin family protein [Gammaproteobacteria bacterium]MCI0590339.1 phasin family protein [Gammaproteobacteria bacterium]